MAFAFRVCCFGDCNVDMILPVDALPVLGGCAFTKTCEVSAGGSMLNTLTALQRLGIPCFPVTKLGRDTFAEIILSHLETHHIPTDAVIRTEQYPTGLVVGLVEPSGEKRWISARLNAADIHITQAEMDAFCLPEILFITGVELNEGQESRQTAISTARRVHEAGGRVYLDPNIRVPSWEISKSSQDAFIEIMPYVDVFLGNQDELCMIGQKEDPTAAADSILRLGTDRLWIKLGKNGCRYVSSQQTASFPPTQAKAVDSSGAGDAFNAAIIFAEANRFDMHRTGTFANLFAGYTVQHFGTVAALPSRETILEMIRLTKERGEKS